MDAIFLLRLCDAFYLIAVAAWLGPILWVLSGHGAAATPGHRASPSAWGVTAGAVALAAFTCGVLAVPEFRGWKALTQIGVLIGGILAMLWVEHSAAPVAPERGRRRLVLLLVAIGLTGSLIARAWRPEPRTRGIVEPTAEELARARYERSAARETSARIESIVEPSPAATSGDRPQSR